MDIQQHFADGPARGAGRPRSPREPALDSLASENQPGSSRSDKGTSLAGLEKAAVQAQSRRVEGEPAKECLWSSAKGSPLRVPRWKEAARATAPEACCARTSLEGESVRSASRLPPLEAQTVFA